MSKSVILLPKLIRQRDAPSYLSMSEPFLMRTFDPTSQRSGKDALFYTTDLTLTTGLIHLKPRTESRASQWRIQHGKIYPRS